MCCALVDAVDRFPAPAVKGADDGERKRLDLRIVTTPIRLR